MLCQGATTLCYTRTRKLQPSPDGREQAVCCRASRCRAPRRTLHAATRSSMPPCHTHSKFDGTGCRWQRARVTCTSRSQAGAVCGTAAARGSDAPGTGPMVLSDASAARIFAVSPHSNCATVALTPATMLSGDAAMCAGCSHTHVRHQHGWLASSVSGCDVTGQVCGNVYSSVVARIAPPNTDDAGTNTRALPVLDATRSATSRAAAPWRSCNCSRTD